MPIDNACRLTFPSGLVLLGGMVSCSLSRGGRTEDEPSSSPGALRDVQSARGMKFNGFRRPGAIHETTSFRARLSYMKL